MPLAPALVLKARAIVYDSMWLRPQACTTKLHCTSTAFRACKPDYRRAPCRASTHSRSSPKAACAATSKACPYPFEWPGKPAMPASSTMLECNPWLPMSKHLCMRPHSRHIDSQSILINWVRCLQRRHHLMASLHHVSQPQHAVMHQCMHVCMLRKQTGTR